MKREYVQTTTHWGAGKFSAFEKGELRSLSFAKFVTLMRALRVGNPEAFDSFWNTTQKELLTRDRR